MYNQGTIYLFRAGQFHQTCACDSVALLQRPELAYEAPQCFLQCTDWHPYGQGTPRIRANFHIEGIDTIISHMYIKHLALGFQFLFRAPN